MTIKNKLYTADHTFNEPFELVLSKGDIFYAEQTLRVLPRKRIVAFGTWQGKLVVAKIFFDKRRAKKHIFKDKSGVKILQDNKIPTPILYKEDSTQDGLCQVLLFERIVNAKNIEDIWQENHSINDFLPALRSIVMELATQHVLGVMQKDLHLKNFLLKGKIVYTLDGGQIEWLPRMLQKKESMQNIALFLSQLGIGAESYQQDLFRYYAKLRGWLVKKQDIKELFNLIHKWNRIRWQRFEKKIFRESSDFSCTQKMGSIKVCDRHYLGSEFVAFLANPESIYQSNKNQILKSGRSSTVIKVTLDQREFVIKRYNIKNSLHFLRRCFRATRAAYCWRLAQKLKLFRIPTAEPVAFIEKRWFKLRGTSYYVMEYVKGVHIDDFFANHRSQENIISGMIKKIVLLLQNLSKLSITHGDLKASNILIDANLSPCLIDLDGAAEHKNSLSLKKAWRKEIKRFLRNFHSQPSVQERFKENLL